MRDSDNDGELTLKDCCNASSNFALNLTLSTRTQLAYAALHVMSQMLSDTTLKSVPKCSSSYL